jgi:hypothetical protein
VLVVPGRQPAHFGGDAAAGGEGGGEFFAHARGAADAAEEGRLEDAGDAEGGGGEEDAEGGVWAYEEILWTDRISYYFSCSDGVVRTACGWQRPLSCSFGV